MKEHGDTCERGMQEKSAVAKLAWENITQSQEKRQQYFNQTRVHRELHIKEALHIHKVHARVYLNCIDGLELSSCWMDSLKGLEQQATYSCL